MIKTYFIYITTNPVNTVFYTGITNNLIKRIYEHRSKKFSGFTLKYNVVKLVYYEMFEDVNLAIQREKQIKAGSRIKKIKLIKSKNPLLKDLYESLKT